MELLKMLSANEIVAQIINFLLLMFLLRIFLWKRVLRLLDERKQRIASEFENIKNSKESLEKLRTEYEAKLSSIDDTARIKILEAVDKGNLIVEQVTEEAHLEAIKIIDSAKRDIKYEILKAKDQLKDQIVEHTMKAAQDVIKEKLTTEEDKKIIEGFLKEIDRQI